MSKPYAEQCTRVCTRTGIAAHLMPPTEEIGNGRVLCPVFPGFLEWRGTGSQDEIDHAAALPLCRRCEDRARRQDAYCNELSQRSDEPQA